MSLLTLEVCDLGTVDYDEALELQYRLVVERLAETIPDTLLLVEHPPVITLGRSAQESDILASRQLLDENGVKVRRISRGGEATYHGPGQIVGYTIINLYNHQRQLRRFIERLEQVFVDLLADSFGLDAAGSSEHRGVWVVNEKITAIGIAVSRGITMHGFAFNVDPVLEHFDWIVPCGIRDRGVTSLSRALGHAVDAEAVKLLLIEQFCRVFGYDWTAIEPDDLRKLGRTNPAHQ